jgi:hypothetical protein
MNKTIFTSYTLVVLSSAAGSDRAVPWPDVARGVSAARPSGGKTAAARFAGRAAGSAAHRSLDRDFVYLLTLSDVSNPGILITIFTELFSNPYW